MIVKTPKSFFRFSGALTLTTVALLTTLVSKKIALHSVADPYFTVEFLAATMDATTFLRESYLKTAFKMFDTDGSGRIDSNELL